VGGRRTFLVLWEINVSAMKRPSFWWDMEVGEQGREATGGGE
jgi:hypothetical protein